MLGGCDHEDGAGDYGSSCVLRAGAGGDRVRGERLGAAGTRALGRAVRLALRPAGDARRPRGGRRRLRRRAHRREARPRPRLRVHGPLPGRARRDPVRGGDPRLPGRPPRHRAPRPGRRGLRGPAQRLPPGSLPLAQRERGRRPPRTVGVGLAITPLLAGAALARGAWLVVPLLLFLANAALLVAVEREDLPEPEPRGRGPIAADRGRVAEALPGDRLPLRRQRSPSTATGPCCT